MAKSSGGLTKWFEEKWVDISLVPKREEVLKSAEELNQEKRSILNVFLPQKQPA